jgi:hypothetical protein
MDLAGASSLPGVSRRGVRGQPCSLASASLEPCMPPAAAHNATSRRLLHGLLGWIGSSWWSGAVPASPHASVPMQTLSTAYQPAGLNPKPSQQPIHCLQPFVGVPFQFEQRVSAVPASHAHTSYTGPRCGLLAPPARQMVCLFQASGSAAARFDCGTRARQVPDVVTLHTDV